MTKHLKSVSDFPTKPPKVEKTFQKARPDNVVRLFDLCYGDRVAVGKLLGIGPSTVGRYINNPTKKIAAFSIERLAGYLADEREAAIGKPKHRFDDLSHQQILAVLRNDIADAKERGLLNLRFENGRLMAAGETVSVQDLD